jgi:8-oxo-dGTP pyrophosphatase MutT (NUDIX family)
VRQFRAPVCFSTNEVDLLEAVAGLTDGEAPEIAALRETFEEAGLRLPALEHVATVWTMPGISTERMDLYLARYEEADRTGGGGGHASEFENISVVEMPLAELAILADNGELTDMKTLALVQTLRLRAPELFR